MPDRSEYTLITGAGSGFGFLTARALLARGDRVIATMRDPAGRHAPAVQALRDIGGELDVIPMDISDSASVDQAVEQALDRHPSIDVVVNNAGVWGAGPAEAFTSAQADTFFATNVLGPMRVNRAVLPHMRESRRGLLIHISATSARLHLPYMAHFAASKAALEGYVEALRYELAPWGVDACLIEPGAYPTEAGDRQLAPADLDRLQAYEMCGPYVERVWGPFSYLSEPDAPDPGEIAHAIEDLIHMPYGSRPLRTVMDPLYPERIARLNRRWEATIAETLTEMGLADLLQPLPQPTDSDG